MTLRAAVHVHSDWSDDGRWSLEGVARGFARRRYGAVLLAEHDRGWDSDRWDKYREACQRRSTADCLLVPGVEYGDADNVVHITVWGDVPFLGAARPTVEILREANELGATSVFAHPGRRGAHQRFIPEWAELLTGIEVWNRKYDGWAPSRNALELAATHPHLRMFPGNDFHTRRQFFPFVLKLEAAERSTAEVFNSLAAGRYEARVFGLDLASLTTSSALAATERLEALRLRAAVPVRELRRRRTQRSTGT